VSRTQAHVYDALQSATGSEMAPHARRRNEVLMNRFSAPIAAAALALLVLGSAAAHADKKPKKKKNVDLSANPLAGVNSKQPDKELFDKAMLAMKKGRFDVSRLLLQNMLNTYPESEYRMRAKLAVGDSWFKEGGTAALTQAEAEYKDFITFFPNAPEAAEAQMKVADIYYQQMEKPDRDPVNAERAELEYRNMINMFPDSTLVPRAKQKLRDVQEVLAERETQIGLFYDSRENFPAAIARLDTKSDQALLGIGDAYAGEAHRIQITPSLPGAIKERMVASYMDRAAQAYAKIITRYPMAPHVEDARDRLVAMNRPVPEPTQEAVAENDAEERSRQPLRFTDKTLDIIKHGPMVVEAVHVGEPSLEDPKRTLAPDVRKQDIAMFNEAANAGKPAAPADAAAPAAGQPPRSDQPSTAPLQMAAPAGGTGVGAEIVSAPAGGAAPVSGPPSAAQPNDGTAGLKPVGTAAAVEPAAEKPAAAPDQINDVKSTGATVTTNADPKAKKPKDDLKDESSSKKKKKKGLSKLNPF
jgi:outer membrane protein assembly factor BamD